MPFRKCVESTTTSAAPPPLWWVWDCAWVALMKQKFNKTKIVDSRNRVEENGAETVANRREIYSHSTISLSSMPDWHDTFDRKSVQNSPLKMFGTTVVPPFAIAKPFNAALLAGVRVA